MSTSRPALLECEILRHRGSASWPMHPGERMVMVSNGHNKFHLTRAATEANRRNVLGGLITGGYPTERVKKWIALLSLERYAPIQRLLKREEAIPEHLIHPLWQSEFVNQLGQWVGRVGSLAEHSKLFLDYSFRQYARHAAAFVSGCSARIFHYRAGYGHESAEEARRKGMILLCDHSIAHPAVIEYLVSHDGRLPPAGHDGRLSRFWTNVLRDINNADCVLANSEFVKETFVHCGWDPGRVHVIYLGIDDEFLVSVPKRDLDVSQDAPLKLLFAGEFGRRKGCFVLVQALQQLGDVDWRLEIAGGIEPIMRRENSSFLAGSRVTFSGYLSRSKLAESLTRSDAFVFPSLAEGSARVIFEALACGCFVITTPNSGSVVRDGTNGIIIPPGDADALAAAIRVAAGDRALTRGIGEENSKFVRESCSQSLYGENLFQLYQLLLAGRRDLGQLGQVRDMSWQP